MALIYSAGVHLRHPQMAAARLDRRMVDDWLMTHDRKEASA